MKFFVKFVALIGSVLCGIGCRTVESRTPLMQNLYSAMRLYAADHDGCFPDGSNSYDALLKLYPEYCPSGKELAGLAGNIDRVIAALKERKSLNEQLTSWKYVRGLMADDNPALALFWEARPGVSPNGSSDPSNGHTVVFVDGDSRQISAADWPSFLAQQERLWNTRRNKNASTAK